MRGGDITGLGSLNLACHSPLVMEGPEKRLWKAGRPDLGELKSAANKNLAQAAESITYNFTFNGQKHVWELKARDGAWIKPWDSRAAFHCCRT